MDKIIQGVLSFQQSDYKEHKDLFGELAHSQSPKVLFITCSDSRIDPNMLTQSKPGDLFICRNAGNIIPPHSNETGGMTASIEYAVAVLGVKDIILCGHTDCGAIHGALDVNSLGLLPHVKEWLSHCRSAVEIVRERNNLAAGEKLEKAYLNETIQENVMQQLQHLRTHPAVAARLATGKLKLHGWIYNIKKGDILCCNQQNYSFEPFKEHYQASIKKLKNAK